VRPHHRSLIALSLLLILIVLIAGFRRVEAATGYMSWSSASSMSTGRYYHTATLLNDGRVLVVGGYVGSTGFGHSLQTADIYDPATNTWSATGSMGTVRWGHTATLLADGRVLISGGLIDGVNSLASAEIYDPATSSWSSTGFMSVARFFHSATLLGDGRVLIAGGYGNTGVLGSAEIYNPISGNWSTTGSLNVGTYKHTATPLPDGRVLVAGGSSSGVTSRAEIYNPLTGTWLSTGAMIGGRYWHAAAALADGRILVVGGDAGGSVILATSEVYDPATGSWLLSGSLNTRRYTHTASALLNGKVIVTGGYNVNAGGDLASTEIYDPATGVWSVAAAMSSRRFYHTATQLTDERLLVTGGATQVATAEIYSYAEDTTAPEVNCNAPESTQWYSTDVAVACTAIDPESGLADSADQAFTLSTNVFNGTETDTAVTNSRQVCNMAGLCTNAGPIGANKVDKKAPTITIVSPIVDATYGLAESVASNYSCADGGSGVSSCQGPIANGFPFDTSSTGTKTFSVVARDQAGNANSQSITYSVHVRFDFTGFFAPIANPPVVNRLKAGSAVPVKFSLGGNQGLSIFAPGYPKVQSTECETYVPLSDVEEIVTAGSSSLVYAAVEDRYVFVWKTDKSWTASCRQLVLRLTDGTSHVVNFTFTK
jgi:hypothetical protein